HRDKKQLESLSVPAETGPCSSFWAGFGFASAGFWPCGQGAGFTGMPRAPRRGPAGWGRCMIGLVLVTHGALANEFKSALEHVVGPQDFCETIAIGPDDNMENRRNDILAAIDK